MANEETEKEVKRNWRKDCGRECAFYSQDVLEKGIFVGLYLFCHHDIRGFMQGGHVLSGINYVYRGNFGGGVFAARLGYGTSGGGA